MIYVDLSKLEGLYDKDPAEFEKLSRSMIEDTINSANAENKERLRAKQWRIDQELGKIKDPVARMNRMVSIFWEGVNDFKKVLSNPYESLRPLEDLEPSNIIDFKRKTQKA